VTREAIGAELGMVRSNGAACGAQMGMIGVTMGGKVEAIR